MSEVPLYRTYSPGGALFLMSEVPLCLQEGGGGVDGRGDPGAELPSTSRKVGMRLPGKGDSKSHGTRPVHQIISMIKWIRTSRLIMKNSVSTEHLQEGGGRGVGVGVLEVARVDPREQL